MDAFRSAASGILTDRHAGRATLAALRSGRLLTIAPALGPQIFRDGLQLKVLPIRLRRRAGLTSSRGGLFEDQLAAEVCGVSS
jgi:hypothetical protein